MFGTAHGVGFCTNGTTDCHVFDLVTKEFLRVPDPPVAPGRYSDPGTPQVRTKGKDVEACAPNLGRCSTVTPRLATIGATATDDAATRLAVFPKTGDVGELWDLDVLQRLGTIALSANGCAQSTAFFDGGIVVYERPSCKQEAEPVLYDPRGSRLARIGGGGFALPTIYPVVFSPTQWLFCNDRQLAIHDRPGGALQRVVDVANGDPDWSGLCLPLAPDTIAVLAHAPLAGAVAIVDPTTGSVERHDPPWCDD